MNYYKAINSLELLDGFTDDELKNNYYIKALQYHPDKNKQSDAKIKFQEILDAYTFLKKDKNIYNSVENNENSYLNILEQFINGILNKNIDAKKILSILNNKCSEISIELLEHFSKDTLLKLYKFTDKYSNILHINKDIVTKLELLIKEYTKNDVIYCIKPSLENLINDEIYKLEIKDDIYYIPTWHHELIYETSNNSIIVQCEPELPKCITLDQYNNLYVNLCMTLKSILNNNTITINIGIKKYIIPINELYIKKYQRYIFYKQGILLIDTKDIYNSKTRANIYVDIYFNDISDEK
tara:strand:+ start:814 stop:1704 length:891 start_codon:yes stop_codon:yes gene_type:complete